MNPLSRQSVIEQLATQLAERRTRRAAYMALARAILMDDLQEHVTRPDLERQSTAIGEPARAA